jgi:hypothetical protein
MTCLRSRASRRCPDAYNRGHGRGDPREKASASSGWTRSGHGLLSTLPGGARPFAADAARAKFRLYGFRAMRFATLAPIPGAYHRDTTDPGSKSCETRQTPPIIAGIIQDATYGAGRVTVDGHETIGNWRRKAGST